MCVRVRILHVHVCLDKWMRFEVYWIYQIRLSSGDLFLIILRLFIFVLEVRSLGEMEVCMCVRIRAVFSLSSCDVIPFLMVLF